jgi:arylsulfatase A-like enzyme
MSVRKRALAIGLVLASAVACARQPPGVFLITLDTTRADRLRCYGGDVPVPALERLAATGIVFDAAVTPLPTTPQAHASILTGLLPRHHGLVRVGQTLPERAVTLAEVLAGRGYACAATVAASILDRRFGLAQGFGEYRAPTSAEASLSADVQVARARAIVTATRGPLFLWLHLYDTHHPYLPPARFRDRFRNDPAAARYSGDAEAFRRAVTDPAAEGRTPADDELRLALELYDGEVRFMDEQLGEFFQFLERSGRWENSLVLVAADHGESFRAEYPFDHSDRLGEEIVRVPLLIKLPGHRAARRVTAPVDLTDVVPTVLDVLGIPVPDGLDGRSLRPLWEGAARPKDGCFSEAPRTGNRRSLGSWIAWRDSRFKLVHNLDLAEGSLFPVVGSIADERADTCEEHPDDCRRMIARALGLAERLGAGRRVAAPEIDDATRETLRGLGYLR